MIITYHPPAPPLSQHDQSKAACPHCCLGHEHPKTWEPGLSMRKSSINSDEPTLFNAKKKCHIQKFTSSLGPLIFQVPSWIYIEWCKERKSGSLFALGWPELVIGDRGELLVYGPLPPWLSGWYGPPIREEVGTSVRVQRTVPLVFSYLHQKQGIFLMTCFVGQDFQWLKSGAVWVLLMKNHENGKQMLEKWTFCASTNGFFWYGSELGAQKKCHKTWMDSTLLKSSALGKWMFKPPDSPERFWPQFLSPETWV